MTTTTATGINFTDIVDVDKNQLDLHIKGNLVKRFVESQFFRMSMLSVIVMNSVIIGLQTDAALVRCLELMDRRLIQD